MSTDSPGVSPEPLLWLRGQKVALGPFTRELVEKYWEWEQDPRVIIGSGFHTTQLRAIWLKVLEHNIVGIRAYETAGFTEVGRLRRAGYWLGAECDEILMDAIPDDFPGPSMVRNLIAG